MNEEGTKVNVDSNSCGVIMLQKFLVTGGVDDYYDQLFAGREYFKLLAVVLEGRTSTRE